MVPWSTDRSSISAVSRLLTLTTDFGTRDAYVASMKGVVLSLAPTLQLIDISHQIAPQDIMEAAFVLKDAFPFYPRGTVHLAVIDPGVGTERPPVALEKDGHYFVGPDNGLFPLILNTCEGMEPDHAVVLDNPAFWRTPTPSPTFHGRDVFAPVAAHLAMGTPLSEFGTSVSHLKQLRWALPIADTQGIQGWIVHIDRFGNCITNIAHSLYTRHAKGRTHKSYVGSAIVQGLHPTYATVSHGEPLVLFGSNGYLEVAVNNGNAATLLSIRKGDPINIVFSD